MDCDEERERCTYAKITLCDKEGLDGQALRSCYQCGSEGLHHHMCANSTPELEKASSVANSTATLCAVCAGVLSLDDVTLLGSDQAAAKLAATESGVPALATAAVSADTIESNESAAGQNAVLQVALQPTASTQASASAPDHI
eukprot:1535094-Pleurochrysis_carterae.AAC.1